MQTQSEYEARALLEKHRAGLIRDGRKVAVQLAASGDEITAQDVLAYMRDAGLIPEDYTGRHNWVACVFKFKGSRRLWQPGDHRNVGCKLRNVHAAPRRWWRLKVDPEEAFEVVGRLTVRERPLPPKVRQGSLFTQEERG